MTQKTVFQAQTEKKCDTHFVKECWIDYKEIAKAETVRICTKKPERICNLPENHTYKIANECRTHYETGKFYFLSRFFSDIFDYFFSLSNAICFQKRY